MSEHNFLLDWVMLFRQQRPNINDKHYKDLVKLALTANVKFGNLSDEICYFARMAAKAEHLSDIDAKRATIINWCPSNEDIFQEIEPFIDRLSKLPHHEAPAELKDDEYLNPQTKFAFSWIFYYTSQLFSYQFPTRQNIDLLVSLINQKRVLEICAGNALWARLLSKRDINIVATDSVEQSGPTWHPVEQLDWSEAIAKYQNADVLLMVWPPPGENPLLVEAVRKFTGTDIILIGSLCDLTGGYELAEFLSSLDPSFSSHKDDFILSKMHKGSFEIGIHHFKIK